MKYYSDDRQDEFVANLFGFKRNGFYLDIGSSSSVGSNNTYFFEKELGWNGICIEKDPHFNESYDRRTCHYFNEDALKVDYVIKFKVLAPKSIDYLSLDVDEASTDVLKRLPLDTYRFKVITIEHDGHFFGDVYKDEQRKILSKYGYMLLCKDVLNQSGRNIGQEHAWEDWWVDPKQFSLETLERLKSDRLNTEQIIAKFK